MCEAPKPTELLLIWKVEPLVDEFVRARSSVEEFLYDDVKVRCHIPVQSQTIGSAALAEPCRPELAPSASCQLLSTARASTVPEPTSRMHWLRECSAASLTCVPKGLRSPRSPMGTLT